MLNEITETRLSLFFSWLYQYFRKLSQLESKKLSLANLQFQNLEQNSVAKTFIHL